MINVEEDQRSFIHRNKTMLSLFAFFLLILAVILYSSFFGKVSFIGSTVSEEETVVTKSISIVAELNSVPNMSLQGEFSQVILRGDSASFIYVGNEKLPIERDSNIVINNFDGDISFGEEIISKLKGKASRVSVDGVPVYPRSKETLKVYFEEPIHYYLLDINEGVSIRKIDYITSGKIILDPQKTIVNLAEDELLIKRFYGDLEVRNKKLRLRGSIDSLDASGEQDISVSI